MNATPLTKIRLTLLVAALSFAQTAGAVGQRAPIRLMTYNTALMNLDATVKTLVNQSGFDISVDTNSSAYGGQPYNWRVHLISEYIKSEDPDVVVLNEVWNDDQKQAFVAELANAQGAKYTHYIQKIQGKPPGFHNPFAQKGMTQANVIDVVAQVLGAPAGLAPIAFLNGLICTLVPPACLTGPITGVDVHMQDSGIMLFSKQPFVPFDAKTFPSKPASVTVLGMNGPNQTWGFGKKEVAVAVYKGARGMDQLASKAAGMVRIQQTQGGVVDVVFSHTNADEEAPSENADVRASQMNEVKHMVTHALTRDELAFDQVYMLGDLNTPGTNKKYGTTEEWSTLFGKNAPNSPWKTNPGTFFACGNSIPCTAAIAGQKKVDEDGTFFTDSWGWETSVEDRSKSNHIDGQYYDYVLHSNPERHCMQHIRIGSEMKDDANGSQLSDHLPIHVDFNLAAPQCTPDLSSPWGPQIVTLDTLSADAVYASKEGAVIAHPGNMQWYYIPDTGTYWIQSFNVGATVAFDVYEEDDLSNPIQPYHGEVDPEQGKHYVATRPLYVRVYAVHADGTPDRTAKGDYQIHFHRATGATPWDAIDLVPTEQQHYTWGGFPQGLSKVWFAFTTNQTFGMGEFATNTIVNTSYNSNFLADDPSSFTNEVYVQTGLNKHVMASYQPIASPGVVTPYLDPTTNTVHGYTLTLPNLPGTSTGPLTFAPRKYYYALSTDGSFGQPPTDLSTYLTFTTDLQYLSLVAIRSLDHKYQSTERDRLDVLFDDFPVDACPNQGIPGMCAEMWLFAPISDDMVPSHPMLRGPFKRGATPSIWAHDPYLIGHWYQLGHDKKGSQVETISLAPGNPGTPGCRPQAATPQLETCEAMMISDSDDYAYKLYYAVRHDLP